MKLNGKLENLIALIALFLIMMLFFGRIVFGDRLIQSDIVQYRGMASEIDQVKEADDGRIIHWTNSMFSGMPTYMITDALFLHNNVGQFVNHAVRQIFPGPAGISMIALICFFILCRSLSINKWLSIIGAFAFLGGSFVIQSLVAGHNSKINAYAYAPLILAGIIYIFRKRPWEGVFCLAFGLTAQIAANHLQITFYTFLICSCLFISELIHQYKKRDLNSLLQPAVYSVLAVIIALGVNYNKLTTIYKYSKHTTRGGQSELVQQSNAEKKSGGLDYEYATQWSYKPIESFTLLIPNFMGGASSEELGEKSHWSDQNQIPPNLRNAPPTYWGQMPFTSGPVYLGAVICALFLFSFFIVKGKNKWWVFIACIIMLLLSWGKFSPFYKMFFYNFPFFDKFRTPMMSLLMLSLLFPMFGILGIDRFLKKKSDQKTVINSFGIILGIIVLFGFLGSAMYGFSGAVDEQLKASGFTRDLLNLLKKDRAMLLRNDAFRSLLFIVASGAAFYYFLKKKLKVQFFVGALALLVFLDLYFVDKRYLSSENFESKAAFESRFTSPSQIDKVIQEDSTHFRVYNLVGNPFAEANTSKYHYSIGGYHAAKLQSYNELIDHQLMNNNRNVLNMLNAKYYIGQGEDGSIGFQENDQALGNAWFVDSLMVAKSANEEMQLIGERNLKNVAIVRNQKIRKSEWDASKAEISLTSYDPEKLVYQAVNNSRARQFAVFSEIYYIQDDGDGWHAFIDGRKVPMFRVNYLLRGIDVPPGEHEIVFQYRHSAFAKRAMVSKFFSAILLLSAIGLLYQEFFKKKNNEQEE